MQQLQAKVREAGEQTERQTAEVFTRVTQGHMDQLQGLIDRVQVLTDTMHRLGPLMHTSTQSAVKTTELLIDGARATNTGVEIVIGLLRETEEFLRNMRE